MRPEKVSDHRTCPLCQREVLPSDNVIFSHGEIIHIECRSTSEGITDSVAHLLRRNAGAEYATAASQGCYTRATNRRQRP